MIFLIVALIWAAALLPPLLRARLDGNPVDSVGKFRRHLRVLESTSPAAGSMASGAGKLNGLSMPAAWAHEARRLRIRRRRQQVVNVLIACMGSTLVLGLLPNLHLLLVLHVAFDVAFVLYARTLVRLRSETAPAAHDRSVVEEATATLPSRSASSQAF